MPCSTTKLVRKNVNNLIALRKIIVKKGEIFKTTIAWYDVDGPAYNFMLDLLKAYQILEFKWLTQAILIYFFACKGVLTNKPNIPTKNIFSQMLLKYQRILTTLCNWSAIPATYSDCREWFLQSRLSAQLFPLPQHLRCCFNTILFLFVTYK